MGDVSRRGKQLRFNYSHQTSSGLHSALSEADDFNDDFNDIVLHALTESNRPIYKHSPSAPNGDHEPLTKDIYDSQVAFKSSKSHDPGGYSTADEGLGASVSTQISDSGEIRRRSFKESGYGDSSGRGSGDTSASDDVFEPDPETKLHRTLSKPPNLDPLQEQDYFSSESTPHASLEERNHRLYAHDNNQPGLTPDLDRLLSHSESNSDCSPVPESGSPNSNISPSAVVPSFRKLGVNSVVSPSNSPVEPLYKKFDFSREHKDPGMAIKPEPTDGDPSAMGAIHGVDLDFSNLSPEQDQVLESPTVLKQTQCESIGFQNSVSALVRVPLLKTESCEKYVPVPFIRMPSLDVDASYKTELQMQKLYKAMMSRCINQQVMKVLTTEESPEVIYSYVQRMHSETDSICPNSLRQSLDSISSITAEGSPEVSQPQRYPENEYDGWKKLYSVQESTLITQLRKHSYCTYRGCKDSDCQMGRGLIRYAEEYLDSKIDTNCKRNFVLEAIANHACCCDVLRCQIPWCNFFMENDYSYEEQVARLQKFYFSGQVITTYESSEDETFTQLNSKVDIGYKEGVDWHCLARLGYYSNAVLAVACDSEKPSFIVVKKERYDSLWHQEVLTLLKPHPRITRHHWILEQEQDTFIASNFEGASLADRMKETPGKLSLSTALKYMDQLASAALFLHKSNIVYLNWTINNVILNEDCKLVKLCNFSCAVPLESYMEEEDKIEDLKMMLPARIVPPELYQKDALELKSDVWGLGCIAYQMLTGDMVYPEYRHEDPSIIRDTFSQLESSLEPDVKALSRFKHVRNIIWNCLKLNPEGRPSLQELRMEILEASSKNQ